MVFRTENVLTSDPIFAEREGRLVLVGNSTVKEDKSELIDTADCVIRFSRVRRWNTGKVGRKTDIICLRGFRGLYQQPIPVGVIRELESMVSYPAWNAAREFWFVGEWLDYKHDVLKYAEYYPRLSSIPKRYIHISQLHRFVFGISPTIVEPMTQGIAVVLYLLSLQALKYWKIQLVGFSDFNVARHDIAKSHDVEKDKELLRKLAKRDFIEICDEQT